MGHSQLRKCTFVILRNVTQKIISESTEITNYTEKNADKFVKIINIHTFENSRLALNIVFIINIEPFFDFMVNKIK